MRLNRLSRAFLLAVALLACAPGCSTSTEEFTSTNKVPVTVASARRGVIRAVIEATGVVRPAPGAELAVVAPQSARIILIPAGVGDRVRKGDLLVQFEIPSLDTEAASRTADLSRARARLENAQAADARVRGLVERGIAARKEAEEARRELADAQAAEAEAQAAVRDVLILTGREIVLAPFSGVVTERRHNPGDMVESSGSDPVLKLIDPGHLQVEAQVLPADLDRVVPGAAARVFGASSAEPLAARVVTRSDSIDPATSTAVVRLAFAGAGRLAVGLPVRVEIMAEQHADAVIVPAAAVAREGQEAFVYIVDSEGRARRTKVAIGIKAGGDIEVLAGLSGSERVVVSGQAALPDGAEVTATP